MGDEFHEENYRILIVILYMLVSALSACMNYSFSPITTSLQTAFDTNLFDIYYLSMSYSILFIPMNFVANYTIERYGIKPSLTICCAAQVIGALFRIFINSSFWYVLIGQTIGAMGNPFACNTLSKASLYWFLPANRIMSTAVMTSAYMIGTSLSFLLGGWFVSDTSEVSIIQDEIEKLMIMYLILAGSVTLAVFVLFKEKPESPTSYVSEMPRENFWAALKTLCSQSEYIYLCIGFAFLLSNYVLFVTFINYLISPFGFSQSEISYIGVGLNFACVFGKITIGFIAGKHITFKNCLISISFLSIFSFGFLLLSLALQNYSILFCFSMILGFFLQMYWAPSLEFSCELVFPIGEANANGNLLLCGCFFNTIFGLVFSAALSYFENNTGVEFIYSYFFLSYLLAAFCFCRIKGEMNRSNKEKEIILANIKQIFE